MRNYTSKRAKKGKTAYRTPDRFIFQKYQKVIKAKIKKK